MAEAGIITLALTYILFTTLAAPVLMWAGAILLLSLAKKLLTKK